jgi:hypothetical protein
MADDTLRTFMDRPLDFFEESVTNMHGIPRAELEELQREPVRRMRKWIVDEHCEPERVLPLWQVPEWKTADFASLG